MQKFITYFSVALFVGIAVYIFYIVVTGRGETVIPQSVVNYTIKGVDISSHNGDVNFNSLARQGIDFVYIKGTEGTDFKDNKFNVNFRKAAEAGLKVGMYHFFRFDTSGYMQALNVINSLRGLKPDLPVAIDLEQWTNPRGISIDSVVKQVEKMADVLAKEGLEVVIYTNKDGYSRFYRNRLEKYPLWLCSFTDIEEKYDWLFWQYSHRGRLEGVDRLVDMNLFNGNDSVWQKYVTSVVRRIQ
ncbi:MAG: hypothetical protein K2M52_03275 [Paramuribaculum sp.]|nr:hypothetical protein [Paramuribaculum sp.]